MKPIWGHLDEEIIARFWSHVDQSGGPESCWPWHQSVDGTGYGKFRLSAAGMSKASRVALTISLGRDIAGNMVAGHVCHDIAAANGRCRGTDCDHRRCCNPTHLVEQTQAENLTGSALTFSGINSMKSHCPQGHVLQAPNLVPSKLSAGLRACLTCNRADSIRNRRHAA